MASTRGWVDCARQPSITRTFSVCRCFVYIPCAHAAWKRELTEVLGVVCCIARVCLIFLEETKFRPRKRSDASGLGHDVPRGKSTGMMVPGSSGAVYCAGHDVFPPDSDQDCFHARCPVVELSEVITVYHLCVIALSRRGGHADAKHGTGTRAVVLLAAKYWTRRTCNGDDRPPRPTNAIPFRSLPASLAFVSFTAPPWCCAVLCCAVLCCVPVSACSRYPARRTTYFGVQYAASQAKDFADLS